MSDLVGVGDESLGSISSIGNNTGDLFNELLAGSLSSLADGLSRLAGGLLHSLGRGAGNVVDLLRVGDALDFKEFGLEDCDTRLGTNMSPGSG